MSGPFSHAIFNLMNINQKSLFKPRSLILLQPFKVGFDLRPSD
jgi:hypothetical protein